MDPYNPDILNNADEFTLIGLYFCLVLIFMYVVGCYCAIRMDRKDNFTHPQNIFIK